MGMLTDEESAYRLPQELLDNTVSLYPKVLRESRWQTNTMLRSSSKREEPAE